MSSKTEPVYGLQTLYEGEATMTKIIEVLDSVSEGWGCDVPMFTLAMDVTGWAHLMVFVRDNMTQHQWDVLKGNFITRVKGL